MRKAIGYKYISLVLLLVAIVGCTSISSAPLPATLNIVHPSPDIPPEIAAFSGIWEGQWIDEQYRHGPDTILVVEKIDTNEAEVIISFGTNVEYKPAYLYKTAKISAGPVIEWTDPNGDQFVFKMDKEPNKIHGTLILKKTGAKFWSIFHKRASK